MATPSLYYISTEGLSQEGRSLIKKRERIIKEALSNANRVWSDRYVEKLEQAYTILAGDFLAIGDDGLRVYNALKLALTDIQLKASQKELPKTFLKLLTADEVGFELTKVQQKVHSLATQVLSAPQPITTFNENESYAFLFESLDAYDLMQHEKHFVAGVLDLSLLKDMEEFEGDTIDSLKGRFEKAVLLFHNEDLSALYLYKKWILSLRELQSKTDQTNDLLSQEIKRVHALAHQEYTRAEKTKEEVDQFLSLDEEQLKDYFHLSTENDVEEKGRQLLNWIVLKHYQVIDKFSSDKKHIEFFELIKQLLNFVETLESVPTTNRARFLQKIGLNKPQQLTRNKIIALCHRHVNAAFESAREKEDFNTFNENSAPLFYLKLADHLQVIPKVVKKEHLNRAAKILTRPSLAAASYAESRETVLNTFIASDANEARKALSCHSEILRAREAFSRSKDEPTRKHFLNEIEKAQSQFLSLFGPMLKDAIASIKEQSDLKAFATALHAKSPLLLFILELAVSANIHSTLFENVKGDIETISAIYQSEIIPTKMASINLIDLSTLTKEGQYKDVEKKMAEILTAGARICHTSFKPLTSFLNADGPAIQTLFIHLLFTQEYESRFGKKPKAEELQEYIQDRYGAEGDTSWVELEIEASQAASQFLKILRAYRLVEEKAMAFYSELSTLFLKEANLLCMTSLSESDHDFIKTNREMLQEHMALSPKEKGFLASNASLQDAQQNNPLELKMALIAYHVFENKSKIQKLNTEALRKLFSSSNRAWKQYLHATIDFTVEGIDHKFRELSKQYPLNKLPLDTVEGFGPISKQALAQLLFSFTIPTDHFAKWALYAKDLSKLNQDPNIKEVCDMIKSSIDFLNEAKRKAETVIKPA